MSRDAPLDCAVEIIHVIDNLGTAGVEPGEIAAIIASHLDGELARITAERDAALQQVKEFEEADVYAEYDGKGSRRDWWSGGAWLYPGDKLIMVRAAVRNVATTPTSPAP